MFKFFAPSFHSGAARVVALALLTCLAGCAPMKSKPSEVQSLSLIPMPREIRVDVQTCGLSPRWSIKTEAPGTQDQYTAELIADEARACFGWNWNASPANSAPERADGVILLRAVAPNPADPPLFREQGYTLRVAPGQMVIEASTSTGRFYGAQTLRQLFRTAHNNSIPALDIRDWPAYAWRGISDDISRGQVSTVREFQAIIRQLAFYKKNLYQPYIEDMFVFDINPNIGRGRGPITKIEMAMLVEEARRHHVTLVPVFEALGHQDRLLSLPENRRYAEIQDTAETPWSFSPVLPEAREFVEVLIDEMAAATPSAPFFHIGGDESWDVGKGTAKERVAEVGVGRVHAEFFSALADHVRLRHGRRTLLYADMLLRHPEALEYLPKDAILVDWHYSVADDYPSVRKLMDYGFRDVFVSPGLWSWANFYPNYKLGFDNVSAFTLVGKREGSTGSITSSWGDSGAENLRENNWPGYAFSAAAEWEPAAAPEAREFLRRFVAIHHGLDSPELAAAIRAVGWPADTGFDTNYPAKIFHRTPRLRQGEDPWLDAMQKLESAMIEARLSIAANRSRVRFNADQLDPLDHAARRYRYLAQRERIMDGITRRLGQKSIADVPSAERESILADITTLRDELADITSEFQTLWMRHRKLPKLDFNISRLNEQISTLQDMIARGQAGELRATSNPWGRWMWFQTQAEEGKQDLGKRHFVRLLPLESIPPSAMMKYWGDDNALVSINGAPLPKATYGDDPREISITHLLRKGQNVIAVEASNDYGKGAVILELTLTRINAAAEQITADEQWRASAEPAPDWKTSPDATAQWQPAKLLGTGLIEPWSFLNW